MSQQSQHQYDEEITRNTKRQKLANNENEHNYPVQLSTTTNNNTPSSLDNIASSLLTSLVPTQSSSPKRLHPTGTALRLLQNQTTQFIDIDTMVINTNSQHSSTAMTTKLSSPNRPLASFRKRNAPKTIINFNTSKLPQAPTAIMTTDTVYTSILDAANQNNHLLSMSTEDLLSRSSSVTSTSDLLPTIPATATSIVNNLRKQMMGFKHQPAPASVALETANIFSSQLPTSVFSAPIPVTLPTKPNGNPHANNLPNFPPQPPNIPNIGVNALLENIIIQNEMDKNKTIENISAFTNPQFLQITDHRTSPQPPFTTMNDISDNSNIIPPNTIENQKDDQTNIATITTMDDKTNTTKTILTHQLSAYDVIKQKRKETRKLWKQRKKRELEAVKQTKKEHKKRLILANTPLSELVELNSERSIVEFIKIATLAGIIAAPDRNARDEIEIVYTNDEGQVISAKEAFKEQSRVFHGAKQTMTAKKHGDIKKIQDSKEQMQQQGGGGFSNINIATKKSVGKMFSALKTTDRDQMKALQLKKLQEFKLKKK